MSSDIIYWFRKFNPVYRSIPGVAKLLDSPSHFSKFEIFRESQLNTYIKGIQKRYLLKKIQKLFIENI